MDDGMSISELAQRADVPVTTLRYYDRIGLVSPQRRGNNYRRYHHEDLQRLQLIKLCQGLGCTLDEASAVLTPDAGSARRELARRKLADVERQMTELVAARAVLSHAARCRHGALQAERCREVSERAARSAALTAHM